MFWQLVEASRSKGAAGAQFIAALKAQLSSKSEEDLIGFQVTTDKLLDDAYRYDVWGVAVLMRGGCSDEQFVDFRAWLISRGRVAFEAAVKDAQAAGDGLAPGGDFGLDTLTSLASQVWADKTGSDASEFWDLMPTRPSRTRPVGTKWEEYELETLFPRVAKRFKR